MIIDFKTTKENKAKKVCEMCEPNPKDRMECWFTYNGENCKRHREKHNK